MSLFSKLFKDDPTKRDYDECVVCGRYAGFTMYVGENRVTFCDACLETMGEILGAYGRYRPLNDNFIVNLNDNEINLSDGTYI